MTLREAVDAFLLLPEIEQRRCSIIVLDKGALAQAGLGLGAFGILMFHAIRRIAAAGGPESE